MKIFAAAAMAVFCLICISPTYAQRAINTLGSPNTETFAGFGTGTVNVTNNTTVAGFYATRTTGNATPNPIVASNGSSATEQLYNFGTTAAADRAAGAINSNAATGTTYLGMRYSNATGGGVLQITVSYTGEQWRSGSGGAEILQFAYQVGPTVTSLTAGTWTNVAALNFTTPINTGSGTLNGNTAANRVVFNQTFAVTIPAGQEIMLRWQDDNAAGDDHGIAIDDVSVTFSTPTVAPASLAGRVTTADGVTGIRGAIVSVQSVTGETISVATNSFGRFKVNGLEAGASYFVTVSARRYGFAQPTQFVSLNDSVTNLNFAASY